MLMNRRDVLRAAVAGAAVGASGGALGAGAQRPQSFAGALVARGPAPQLGGNAALYAGFIGGWEAEGEARLPDGSRRRHFWQMHFAWVLEGWAIQDVWITPVRQGAHFRESEPWGPFSNQYGTTLRVYDEKLDAWRVTWIDPVARYRADLIGRAMDGTAGSGIFQEGTGSDGAKLRWIFSDFAGDRFRWRADVSRDGGATWYHALDLLARRT